ncbi:MAG TPA: hypothetical protein DD392_02965 [Ruminococcus sp.]|nr:hypothetical protein [Ruminococcus sp.]
MSEKRKFSKKDIIKNIAIVFLAVMLVLTFFSNTIMNFSLPEVNAQYVSSGTINEKIRGTGIAEANNTYEVNISETRTIKSVNIKSGSTVKAGQSLFTLEDTESEELKTAQDSLDTMELEYQKALLNDVLPDYTSDNLSIQNAREDLQKAIQQRDSLSSSGNSGIDDIKNRITSLQNEIKTLTSNQENLQGAVTAIDSEEYSSAYLSSYNDLISANLAVTSASDALENAKNNQLRYEPSENDTGSAELQTSYTAKQREIELLKLEIERLKEDLSSKGDSDTETERLITDKEYSLKYAEEDLKNLENQLNAAVDRESKLADAKNAVSDAETNLSKAKSDLRNKASEIKSSISSQLISVADDISDRNSKLEAAQAELENAQNSSTAVMTWDEANENVKSAQRALNELLVAFAKTQKDDKLANALADLDIEAQAEKIKKQEETVEKLKKQSSETDILSKVDGVVTQINCVAGEKTSADTPMAVIQVTDKGYSVSFSVSNELSKKVKIGQEAEITNLYDGNASAVLQSIKPDPDNSKQKLLVFSVTGDISANQSLNISAGGKSAKYDMVVPKSAVKEDKDGKFILIVQAKSSPLGNRYKAYKVNVEVLASDDTSAAVSGSISGNEFVITASDTPIESGMQVRLAEE